MKMDLERIGSRHRDNSHHFAAESEALDQIAKEASVTLLPSVQIDRKIATFA